MSSDLYCYKAFGLTIHSELRMPEFLAATGPPDVQYRLGELAVPEHPAGCLDDVNAGAGQPTSGLDQPAGGHLRGFGGCADGTLLYWSHIGVFLVEDGAHVTVSPLPGADEGLVRMVLSGPALGVLLAQRGGTVFHAGVVGCPAAGGAAVAFVARCGEGKSTMVAAMYQNGCDILSDDLMLADLGADGVIVQPGFPHAKLTFESAAALLEDAETLTQLARCVEKRGRPIERFAPHALPLAAVFVLEDGPDVQAVPLSGHQALAALLPHWYGAGFNGQLVDILGRTRHFQETAAMAARVPVYRLVRPRCYERLADVVAEVNRAVSGCAGGSVATCPRPTAGAHSAAGDTARVTT